MAETLAAICGKPLAPGVRLMASRLRSRPLTDTRRLAATTNRSRRPKKLARWKKLPWKVKVKGSIGNPAGPTPLPGGSAAVDDGVEAPGVGGEEAELDDELEAEDGLFGGLRSHG